MAMKRRFTREQFWSLTPEQRSAQLQEWLQFHSIGGAAAGGYIGNGMRVGYSVTSPHSWKQFEQVLDCTIAQLQASDIDSTVHGSGRIMSNIAGLAKVTDTTLKMMRDQSLVTAPNQNALFALNSAQTLIWLRVEIPDGPDLSIANYEAYEYQVRVKSWNPTAPINDKQTVDAVFLFSGTTFTRYDPAGSAF